MPDTFTLTINLGNDAMQDMRDISHAVHELARRLDEFGGVDALPNSAGGPIRDINGNKVGRWKLQ